MDWIGSGAIFRLLPLFQTLFFIATAATTTTARVVTHRFAAVLIGPAWFWRQFVDDFGRWRRLLASFTLIGSVYDAAAAAVVALRYGDRRRRMRLLLGRRCRERRRIHSGFPRWHFASCRRTESCRCNKPVTLASRKEVHIQRRHRLISKAQ